MEMEELTGDRPAPPPPHLPLPAPGDPPAPPAGADPPLPRLLRLQALAQPRPRRPLPPPLPRLPRGDASRPRLLQQPAGASPLRHGRALLDNFGSGTLLVWDLVTGDQRHLPAPPACEGTYNAAVLCAAGHTDHGDCHSCPFLVVYVFSPSNSAICACVWSSATGVWGEITSIDTQSLSVDGTPSALVGNTLYWQLEYSSIVEYDLDNHRLGLTEEFPYDARCSYPGQILLMPTEDGRLGLAGVEGLNLHLWSLMPSVDGLATWRHQRVIDLKNFLAPEVGATRIYVVEPVGFAEDAGVIFISVHPSVYMIHLKSMRIKEVSEKGTYGTVIPYASFYAPGITIGGGDDQAEMLNNS